MNIQLGDKLVETYSVNEEDLISAIHYNLPNVLGTYNIVKWAEITSAKVLLNNLIDDDLSVGIRIDIKHTGIALLNQSVQISAEITSIRGQLIGFDIEVVSEEEKIASIKHSRVIISKASLDKKIELKFKRSKEI